MGIGREWGYQQAGPSGLGAILICLAKHVQVRQFFAGRTTRDIQEAQLTPKGHSTALPVCGCPRPPPNHDHPFLSHHYLFLTPFSLFFVRNGHKSQCKSIRVDILFYITKLSIHNIKGGRS